MCDKFKYIKSGIMFFLLFPYCLFVGILQQDAVNYEKWHKYHQKKLDNIIENIRSKIWD